MNYIILNGVKSTAVRGLLIQSLPPITKPQIRTSVEEIDGRDGDIVTKLGYSAYDKELTIGLYGDYNVDDAIEYFDSEGDVVFSNEPDKYYKYQIIEQIDFERLIRFKTATVKMHVQPFKYDAVDRYLSAYSQLMEFGDYNSTLNSVTLTATDEKITLTGTASQNTAFYLPINNITPDNGNYTLSVNISGIAKNCELRLISGDTSNSFGGKAVALNDNTALTLNADDTGTLTYNYLWLFIPDLRQVNFTMAVTFTNNNFNSVTLRNRGNVIARPKVTLYGTGKNELILNGKTVLTVNIDEDYITIDSAEMNAYNGNVLKNRQVTGDYSNLVLNIGKNTLSWNGTITKVVIENYSRWI